MSYSNNIHSVLELLDIQDSPGAAHYCNVLVSICTSIEFDDSELLVSALKSLINFGVLNFLEF